MKKEEIFVRFNQSNNMAKGGLIIGSVVLGAFLGSKVIKFVKKEIKKSNERMMKIVHNNLKLVNDGEFVDILVSTTTDDYSRTTIHKRWTKKNDEVLYLGKIYYTTELSDEEKRMKQISRLTNLATKTVTAFSKK